MKIFFVSCGLIFLLCVVPDSASPQSKFSEDDKRRITTSETVLIKNNSSPEFNDINKASKEEFSIEGSVLEPSVAEEFGAPKGDTEDSIKPSVANIMTQNSGTLNDILSNDTPVVLTSETSSAELEKLADVPFAISSQNEEVFVKNSSFLNENIVQNIITNISHPDATTIVNDSVAEDVRVVQRNVSEEKNEDIPSFSEWAQKRLEEAEKNEQVNTSLKGQNVNGKGSNAKLRWKNYASLDCGAKVIAANPESISPGAVLSRSTDEYKLNTCTSRIWFVVELCEAIQTKKIDLANYELFSSSPKDFTVSVSDRYPTRDWTVVGKFTAKDERDVQSFDLDTQIFGKYIKVEIKSHYGSEHYCPISLFRAYGTSVFEVLQKEDPAHVNRVEDDDDDEDDDNMISSDQESEDTQKNLFSSATDAVMSIVKRAAEVLGVNNQTTLNDTNGTIKYSPLINTCSTPRHIIFCSNCSDTLFGQIYELMSCEATQIKKLVSIPAVYKVLTNSQTCEQFGYNLRTSVPHNNDANFVQSFFAMKYIGAMCNELVIVENRTVLNVSQQFPNTTGNLTTEKIISMKVQEAQTNKPEMATTVNHILNKSVITDPEKLENRSDNISNASNADDTSYTSQIKPTKAMTADPDLSQTHIEINVDKPSEILTVDKSDSEMPLTASSESFSENKTELGTDAEVSTEGIDGLDDHLDHIISELNVDSQSIHSSTSTTTNSPQAQKESVFLRLSNRIKALERNMSLSSQYLEELSKRYKKQVEEMQNLLEKSIITFREENIKKDDRNKQLEDRLDKLTAAVDSLIVERSNWLLIIYWLICIIVCMSTLYFFCWKSTTNITSAAAHKETIEVLRRKSVDVVNHNPPEEKKRRPSDQVMKIVRCSILNREEEKNKPSHRSRKKRKKNALRKSSSTNNLKVEKCYECLETDEKNGADWVEKCHKVIQDMPFVLDESDHSTLEARSLENDFLKAESPTYAQTVFNFKLNKDASQNIENGVDLSERSTHSDISESRCSSTPDKTTENSSSIVEPIRKEKKGFKKFLKKVF